MSPSSPQDVVVLLPLVLGLLTIVVTIGVHAVALGAAAQIIRREYHVQRAGRGFWTDTVIVGVVTVVALFAHLFEIAIWAVLYEACGEFTGFGPAFYHSAVNYTTLGYGDLVMSSSWRLLGPLEAADGMLLFGVSTAIIFAVMQRLFQTRSAAVHAAHKHH
jgi:hypothetical protein